MLFEHNILRVLRFYETSVQKNFLKVVPGRYLAFVQIPRCDNTGLHIRPVCFDTGKGHPQAFYARQPLHRINAWHRTNELLHQAKIVVRLWPFWPQMIHDRPHGESGQSIEFGPFGKLISQ